MIGCPRRTSQGALCEHSQRLALQAFLLHSITLGGTSAVPPSRGFLPEQRCRFLDVDEREGPCMCVQERCSEVLVLCKKLTSKDVSVEPMNTWGPELQGEPATVLEGWGTI